jgi:hypothetical protein
MIKMKKDGVIEFEVRHDENNGWLVININNINTYLSTSCKQERITYPIFTVSASAFSRQQPPWRIVLSVA